jgi:hypothetical protein
VKSYTRESRGDRSALSIGGEGQHSLISKTGNGQSELWLYPLFFQVLPRRLRIVGYINVLGVRLGEGSAPVFAMGSFRIQKRARIPHRSLPPCQICCLEQQGREACAGLQLQHSSGWPTSAGQRHRNQPFNITMRQGHPPEGWGVTPERRARKAQRS